MFGCECCCVSTVVYAVGALTILAKLVPFLLGLFKKEKPIELQEKNYKKDTVYLYQFPGTSTCSSISPYCIKVEAFLRIHNIKFERRDIFVARGANGKLPFIELNGEQIADSQVILRALAEKFGLTTYPDKKAEAIGHAVDRLIDNHTFYLVIYFKRLFGGPLASEVAFPEAPAFVKSIIECLAGWHLKRLLAKRVRSALGKFTDAQYETMLRYDLTQIQEILGEQQYLTGAKPTIVDCTFFGQFGSTYYAMTQSKIHTILAEPAFLPLKQYIERFRDDVFGTAFHK